MIPVPFTAQGFSAFSGEISDNGRNLDDFEPPVPVKAG